MQTVNNVSNELLTFDVSGWIDRYWRHLGKSYNSITQIQKYWRVNFGIGSSRIENIEIIERCNLFVVSKKSGWTGGLCKHTAAAISTGTRTHGIKNIWQWRRRVGSVAMRQLPRDNTIRTLFYRKQSLFTTNDPEQTYAILSRKLNKMNVFESESDRIST